MQAREPHPKRQCLPSSNDDVLLQPVDVVDLSDELLPEHLLSDADTESDLSQLSVSCESSASSMTPPLA
jgi:hypothetical protein